MEQSCREKRIGEENEEIGNKNVFLITYKYDASIFDKNLLFCWGTKERETMSLNHSKGDMH